MSSDTWTPKAAAMQSEALMVEPIRAALQHVHDLDLTETEYASGYGVADVVGGRACPRAWQERENLGLATGLRPQEVRLLSALPPMRWIPLDEAAFRAALALSTAATVARLLARIGVLESRGSRVRLLKPVPAPVTDLVAVEAKLTRWRDALRQARRYAYFANHVYIAIVARLADRVDRGSLYRARCGLLAVEAHRAFIAVPSPRRKPVDPTMFRNCSEYLYGRALLQCP